MISHDIATLRQALEGGRLAPYLGPGVLDLGGAAVACPTSPEALVALLTSRASVPHKIRNNLTAAAQFIENFKHRRSLVGAMTEAFTRAAPPNALHHLVAGLPQLPLVVSTWYDDALAAALAARADWGRVQGVSQAEQRGGGWVKYYARDGREATPESAPRWATLLYQPLGAIDPAQNFLVSDSDFVEVLTEIDIQTPIPLEVQVRRAGLGFLFMGQRFATQLERSFARQVIKRSQGPHFAVLPGPLTRNEQRFLEEQAIVRIDTPLEVFSAALIDAASGAPLTATG